MAIICYAHLNQNNSRHQKPGLSNLTASHEEQEVALFIKQQAYQDCEAMLSVHYYATRLYRDERAAGHGVSSSCVRGGLQLTNVNSSLQLTQHTQHSDRNGIMSPEISSAE